jgi:hypothetical protein
MQQRAVPACRLPVRNENQRAGSADVAPGPGRVRRRGEVCAARDSEWDRCGAFSHTRHGLLSIYRSASADRRGRVGELSLDLDHAERWVSCCDPVVIVVLRDNGQAVLDCRRGDQGICELDHPVDSGGSAIGDEARPADHD